MTLTINETSFSNVKEFFINSCELTIVFFDDHSYSSIDDIEKLLNKAGISVFNYHFNHKDCYGNDSIYGTDIICVINKNILSNLNLYIIS